MDLIVSDLDLPGMGGLQLLPLLRNRIGRHVPALAISARSEANTEAEARAAGFDGFLRKPLDAAGLRAALAATAAGSAESGGVAHVGDVVDEARSRHDVLFVPGPNRRSPCRNPCAYIRTITLPSGNLNCPSIAASSSSNFISRTSLAASTVSGDSGST
ncbi:MAG: response regulator [Xanthomonadales bacterium]|nr:response regulator [Xanthomonadales bacterium]